MRPLEFFVDVLYFIILSLFHYLYFIILSIIASIHRSDQETFRSKCFVRLRKHARADTPL